MRSTRSMPLSTGWRNRFAVTSASSEITTKRRNCQKTQAPDLSQEGIMEIVDLLAPEAVIAALKAQSKKQLLQEMSERAAPIAGLPERRIFETLIERERLGSTGMGQGIAIPHGRLAV